MESFASRIFIDDKLANRLKPHLSVWLEEKVVVDEQL
jgi:hypothetical protein